MIYSPMEAFDLRLAIAQGIFSALTEAAIDFVAGENKPWTYYTGVALGATAAATGLPDAALTLYVVGDSVDFLFFHSPDGSLAKVFIDGLESAAIDSYNPVPSWITNTISLTGAILHRIDIINTVNTNSSKTSSVNWLAVGPVQVNGGTALPRSETFMNILSAQIQDSEQDTKTVSVPFYLPNGFTVAQVQTWADNALAKLDAVIGGQLMSAGVTFGLTLPSGAKSSPVAASLNERGGLITFNTSGPRNDSFWIPGILPAIMPGDSFSLSQTDIAALITVLTTTTNSIRPRTAQDYNYTAARKGSKSIRR